MLFKSVAFFTLAALGVSASYDHVNHLVSRQISSSEIPAACNSTCTTALSIANACASNDTATCLSVCSSTNFQSFVGCLQCVVNNTPGVTSSDLTQLQSAITQLASACSAAGSSVAATTLTAGASGASASASGASGSASGAVSSLASVSAAASSAASAISASGGSASGAATSAASAAASSKAAAGMAAAVPQGTFAAALLGLVGVVGGAAMVL